MKIALWICIFLSVNARAHDHVSPEVAVREELTHHDLIRVGISVSPHLGHPSATATVVRRLRELGYRGEIEVIYQTTDKNHDIPFRLAKVFPDYDPVLPIAQKIPGEKISFYSEEYFQHHPELFPAVELGVMGGDDYDTPAGFLNVAYLLVVQPMGWVHPPELRVAGGGVLDLVSTDDVPFAFNEPDLDRVVAGLLNHSTRQTAGLVAIARSLDRFDLAAFYGHGLHYHTSQLLTYLTAIATAQRSKPKLFPLGVVVPVMIDLDEYRLEMINQQLRAAKLDERVVTINLTDPNFADALDRLKPDQILMVRAGHIPRPAYELFFHRSTIAPVIGGLNTMNFVGQFGKPYLGSNDHEIHHLKYVDPHRINDFMYKRIEYTAQTLVYGLKDNPHAAVGVAMFLIEARDPESALSRYFAKHRLQIGPSDDRMVRALYEMIELRRSIEANCEPNFERAYSINAVVREASKRRPPIGSIRLSPPPAASPES